MEAPHSDILTRLQGYADRMTISQVVLFFERLGMSVTKTMIQNYVRVSVLPPPHDNRYYTKNHILLIYLIDQLKTVFSLDEIGKLFAPVIMEAFEAYSKSEMSVICRTYLNFYNNGLTTDAPQIKDPFYLNLSLAAGCVALKHTLRHNLDAEM